MDNVPGTNLVECECCRCSTCVVLGRVRVQAVEGGHGEVGTGGVGGGEVDWEGA